ncbi:MAG: polysaccharide pyruvyl transferase family protein [Ruminococcaceae bacterium]|nr:polysaccharide pyruvyl transferase family protein [Oscillospiraceae bacterium]
MKISTITFYRSRNYGAVLQAYALQQALISCGYETAIVDYCRVLNDKKSLKQKIRQMALIALEVVHYKSRLRFKNRFETFLNENVKLTNRYDDYDALVKSPPQSDMYLIGSDQVWNITYRYRPEFFADFAPKNVKVASYAASIGRYDYNQVQLEKFEKGLEKVYPISVRENSAKDFIKEKFNKESLVHLDPVFLLDKEQWSKVADEPQKEEKYILCYALTGSSLMKKAAEKLRKETGYKIVSISPTAVNFINGDYNVFDAGPKQFLSYIKNAEVVLTNSFHGTAFSIIFEKEFYNFTSDFYSSRTTNILQQLDLIDRIAKSLKDVSLEKLDYKNVSIKKRKLIEESYAYLKSLEESI